MSHWQKIRDAAAVLRQEICAASDLNQTKLLPAQEFLKKAAEYLELDLIPEHPESGNLSGALAVLDEDCIHFNNHLKDWYKAFCIAHEIGHHRLHHQSLHCSQEEIQDIAGDAAGTSGVEKIVGYGAGMRREREANLFALELLLPCAALRCVYLENNLNARHISELVEMPIEVVAGQIARALLVPSGDENKSARNISERHELDDSQRLAAETVKTPTLVAAGPGTGKTQTLTSRIAHLINQGIEPKRILALTFSNKAAEEMRERIAKINESAAAQIQVMTFHAFGFDILRSYWVEAELDPRSNLLDKIDALLYLEKNLNYLKLEHYQNLPDPTRNLAAILSAISRAKDELCSPEEYRILGEKMLTDANTSGDEDLRIKAEKVLETAWVYDFYQQYLEREKLLDFGDLVYRPVRLLRENECVSREVRAKYDAILVDEFQDVNRACGVLLKEIAVDGKGLWAVGDLRQSVYRWRGASPANINLFNIDFPNAETVSLEINYRSRREIIEVFSNFAGQMKAAGADFFSAWQAKRGAAPAGNNLAINLEICDSIETEAGQIAEHISRLQHAEGIMFKDCAVICRTHGQLNKFAKILSEKGIPVFYLGEIFEREEVRDLLALLDLKSSLDGHALVRVARFPEYQIPLSDARKIITAQKEHQKTFAEIIADENQGMDLSEKGKSGAMKLARHLRTFSPKISVWSFLANYLFAESDYLKVLFATEDVNSQSRRLAIYQFLRLAQATEERFASANTRTPIQEFLNYIKKLAHFNEDKNYAQIPPEAENLDAVRLLTVHSAKGLEFPAVFLPYLGKGKIPSNRQVQTCPNPDKMIASETDFHDEEEECLFFVAMSRARDYLHFSRANDYSKNHSRFLEILEQFLPTASQIEIVSGALTEKLSEAPKMFPPQTFYSADLDRFLRCGRDYFYTNVLGLKSVGDKSIYLKFHSCVYDTIGSMHSIKQMASIELTEENALARLNDFWNAAEIDLHPYAPVYRARAEEIVRLMCRKMDEGVSGSEITRPTYELKLPNGSVRVRIDAVELVETAGEKTAIIRKYKTGKSPKEVKVEDAEVLMTLAVQEEFPEAKPYLQRIYLSDDTPREVLLTAKIIKNRLEKYEKAIDEITKRRFEPSPGDDKCPYCPHFFICPSGDIKS